MSLKKIGPGTNRDPKKNSQYGTTLYPTNNKVKLLKPVNGRMHLATGAGHRWIISNQPSSRVVLQVICKGIKNGGLL